MPILPENKARYPKDWALRSRFIRFYRARNQCEWCGANNYQPHPVTGSKVVLTVAHLDHTPENSSLLNLMAMCQRCHHRYDSEHRRETRMRRKRDAQISSGQLPLLNIHDV